jgi:DNA-binding beta-propeller fold protein YncE
VAGAGNAFVVSSRETGTPFLVDVSRRSPSVVVAFGGPGREPLEFMRPAGFVVDFASETVLVSDSGNARLQRLRLGRTPGNPRRFDPARTAFIEDLDLDDQERLDIEPARWDLDPATVAPGTLVRDRRRRLVVADTASRRIVLLGKDFRLVGAWGGFGDEDGRFRQTAGLALDPAGETLYVLDSGRRRVQAFDLDGRFLFAWGGPGDEPGAFTAPSGIAAGRDGSIYVVDRGANRVQRFDRRGVRLSAWGSAGTGPGQFWKPEGVHVDGRGRVIVLDSGNRRAQAFTSSGRFLWEMPLDPAKLPVGSAHGSKPAPPAAPIAETPGACRLNAASNAGRYTVCATSIPDPVPLNQPFALSVAIYDNVRRGELAQRVLLNVDAAMPEHRHGMSLTPKVRAASGPVVQDVPHGHGAMGDGRFEIEGMLFHMPGRWEFHFDITHGAITERAQIAIDLD